MGLAVQPDCVKGQVVRGSVCGDMHHKDLLGSITSREYGSVSGSGFLSSAAWTATQKSTVIDKSIKLHDSENMHSLLH